MSKRPQADVEELSRLIAKAEREINHRNEMLAQGLNFVEEDEELEAQDENGGLGFNEEDAEEERDRVAVSAVASASQDIAPLATANSPSEPLLKKPAIELPSAPQIKNAAAAVKPEVVVTPNVSLCDAMSQLYRLALALEKDILFHKMNRDFILVADEKWRSHNTNFVSRAGFLNQKINGSEVLKRIFAGEIALQDNVGAESILKNLAVKSLQDDRGDSRYIPKLAQYIAEFYSNIFTEKCGDIYTRQNFHKFLKASEKFTQSCVENSILSVKEAKEMTSVIDGFKSKFALPSEEISSNLKQAELKFLLAGKRLFKEYEPFSMDTAFLFTRIKSNASHRERDLADSQKSKLWWEKSLTREKKMQFGSQNFSEYATNQGKISFDDIDFMVIATKVHDTLRGMSAAEKSPLAEFILAGEELSSCYVQSNALCQQLDAKPGASPSSAAVSSTSASAARKL